MRRNLIILAVGLSFGASACSDSQLPEAIYENRVDTVTVYALDGTPVNTRSGYDLVGRNSVRTDLSGTFDFAFNIDTAGRALLLPAGALDIATNAGFAGTTGTFADVRVAPAVEYTTDEGWPIIPGDVVAARSRLVSCSALGNLSYYAKIGIIAIDPNERRLTFEVLSNINCGYRSLEPGRPTQ